MASHYLVDRQLRDLLSFDEHDPDNLLAVYHHNVQSFNLRRGTVPATLRFCDAHSTAYFCGSPITVVAGAARAAILSHLHVGGCWLHCRWRATESSDRQKHHQ